MANPRTRRLCSLFDLRLETLGASEVAWLYPFHADVRHIYALLTVKRWIFAAAVKKDSAVSDTPSPAERLERHAARDADALAEADRAAEAAAEGAISMWRARWQPPNAAPCVIAKAMDPQFRVCFPLAAHALNHVETAFELRTHLPWVARSSARIAFEHALTAQWVLLTDSGEKRLADYFSERDYVRRNRYVEAIVELGQNDTSFAARHGLSNGELESIAGRRPEKSGFPTFEQICARFDPTGLLYDVQRDLTQSVHPSNGLVIAHLLRNTDATPRGVDWRGTNGFPGELVRGAALAGVWALYALEVCRDGQPFVAEVRLLGEARKLPVDLRASDQRPQWQPRSAYWSD